MIITLRLRSVKDPEDIVRLIESLEASVISYEHDPKTGRMDVRVATKLGIGQVDRAVWHLGASLVNSPYSRSFLAQPFVPFRKETPL